MELFPRSVLPSEIINMHDQRVMPWPAFVIGVSLEPTEITPAALALNEELDKIPAQPGDEISL